MAGRKAEAQRAPVLPRRTGLEAWRASRWVPGASPVILWRFVFYSCLPQPAETAPVPRPPEKPSLQLPKLERVSAAECTKQ